MFNWKKMTKTFEGFRGLPYKDTQGIPTVGYGFNISAGGVPQEVAAGKRAMSTEEADAIFEPKYLEAENRAAAFAGPVYDALPENQKAVLNDMSYNLGNKIFKFKNMRAAIQEQRLGDVPVEMQDSKWYKQVGNRGASLIDIWNSTPTP
jgi:GH24 family phage-related lysozyme (muramidase)